MKHSNSKVFPRKHGHGNSDSKNKRKQATISIYLGGLTTDILARLTY